MAVKVSGSDGVNQSQVAGATQLPVGTTAQRPANPEAGMIRFNTDQGVIEGYDPAVDDWLDINKITGIFASGGTVTDIEQDGQTFRVHTFTSSGTFDVARGGDVEYLVVGGGGGGRTRGGAGGAGGYRCSVPNESSGGNTPPENKLSLNSGTYQIIVGAGGAEASNGESSIFDNITSLGGGAGGNLTNSNPDDLNGNDGGSGGGGGSWNSSGGSNSASPGSGTAGQGSDGSDGQYSGASASGRHSGGGGGAGGSATFVPNGNGGDGGLGIESNITGSLVARGGGGGGWAATGSGGAGGFGGGGKGYAADDFNGPSGDPGVENTGGGGGSGEFGGSGVSNGGSGIVIVRYRIG